MIRTLRYITLIIIACIPFALVAKPKEEKKIKWTTLYQANSDKSINEAKKEAVMQAELDALACEFGTYMAGTNYTAIKDGESHFSSVNVSQIRGEKIKDIEEPKFEISWIDNMLVINCTVHFLGREIEKSQTELDIHLLRNGYTEKYESTTFKSNDDLFVSFQSPVDGYLAIFLLDETEKAYTLLPYKRDGIASFPIKHGKKYLFFCDDKKYFAQNGKIVAPRNFDNVQNIFLYTDKKTEMNQIYFVFSSNEFSQPNANTDGDLNELPVSKFNSWLAKCRMDDKLVALPIDITINGK